MRCFDFFRIDDPALYRRAISEKLSDTATMAGKKGVIPVLENEGSCNTRTGAETAKVLDAVRCPYLMPNWDPGNAAELGEKPYPDRYNLLPKERIGHCHYKDAVRTADGKGYEWAAMGSGILDWAGPYRVLKRDGYRFAVSLETHWRARAHVQRSIFRKGRP